MVCIFCRFSRPPNAAAHRSNTCSLVCAWIKNEATHSRVAALNIWLPTCSYGPRREDGQSSAVAAVPAGGLESGMADLPITRREATQVLSAAACAPLVGAASPDICFLSAVEMASLIRRKKLSARETMDAHLKQIERI